MLPCRIVCEAYHDGCHKDCASWKDYLERQSAEREAKKRYITYHTARCAEITRQFRALQTKRRAW